MKNAIDKEDMTSNDVFVLEPFTYSIYLRCESCETLTKVIDQTNEKNELRLIETCLQV